MKQYTLFFWFFWLFCNSTSAQSPVFSQFYAFPTAMNPAYVSAIQGAEVSTGYRRQWGQLQTGLHTKALQAGIRTCNVPLAFGGYYTQVNETYFGYSRREGGLQVGAFVPVQERFSLHGGLQAGLGSHQVGYQELLFTGQLDPVFGQVSVPSTYFSGDGTRVETYEIGAGVVGRGQFSWRNSDLPASLGMSVHHLAGSRDVSFLRVPGKQSRRWTAHGSITTPIVSGIGRKDALYLNWVARYEFESSLRRTSLGVICQYDAVHIGGMYQWNKKPVSIRNTNGLSLVLGGDFRLRQGSHFTLQYAYDGALGGLGQAATQGAHELVVVFVFPQNCIFKERNKRGSTDCFYFSGKGYRRFLN